VNRVGWGEVSDQMAIEKSVGFQAASSHAAESGYSVLDEMHVFYNSISIILRQWLHDHIRSFSSECYSTG